MNTLSIFHLEVNIVYVYIIDNTSLNEVAGGSLYDLCTHVRSPLWQRYPGEFYNQDQIDW